MSSKFSAPNVRTNKPKVCRKPPPPLPDPRGPFYERELQFYVYWRDLFGSDQIDFTGTGRFTPDPSTFTWEGLVLGSGYILEVGMSSAPPHEQAAIEVTLLLNGTPVGNFAVWPYPIEPSDHFDTGLIILAPPPVGVDVRVRITS